MQHGSHLNAYPRNQRPLTATAPANAETASNVTAVAVPRSYQAACATAFLMSHACFLSFL
ncbi:MAG: hypothetical protein KME29_18865 [Calothrix sp. FI2-JRJ7]|jgi:hypothetical protein|nr:hypothetical protein [Calothrix sp. FI2-JRJ7]